MDKKRYVCGFLFSQDGTKVVLISKTDKHELKWMAGMLNGVGGKVNAGELPHNAMRREFLEEAGVDVWGWTQVCTLSFNTAEIIFYKIFSGSIDDVKTVTDEKITVIDVADLHQYPIVNNLSWLIPICRDNEVGGASLIIGKIK